MVIFAAMHVAALVFGALLFAMFLRSESVKPWQDRREDDDGGDGGSDRVSDRPPAGPRGGGIPLPDAQPSPRRLRDAHEKLSDAPRPQRRKAREPERTPTPR